MGGVFRGSLWGLEFMMADCDSSLRFEFVAVFYFFPVFYKILCGLFSGGFMCFFMFFIIEFITDLLWFF